jgi:hypothetical protein
VNIPGDRLIVDRSLVAAILTDSHFWIPVAVMIFGTILLVLLTH